MLSRQAHGGGIATRARVHTRATVVHEASSGERRVVDCSTRHDVDTWCDTWSVSRRLKQLERPRSSARM